MGRMCGKEKKKRKKEKIIKGEDTLKTGFLGHLPGRIELSVVVVVCWYGFFFTMTALLHFWLVPDWDLNPMEFVS